MAFITNKDLYLYGLSGGAEKWYAGQIGKIQAAVQDGDWNRMLAEVMAIVPNGNIPPEDFLADPSNINAVKLKLSEAFQNDPKLLEVAKTAVDSMASRFMEARKAMFSVSPFATPEQLRPQTASESVFASPTTATPVVTGPGGVPWPQGVPLPTTNTSQPGQYPGQTSPAQTGSAPVSQRAGSSNNLFLAAGFGLLGLGLIVYASRR